jgi:regulation of enolase protein 1 (concanavalin A-like superfamily)
MNEKCKYIIASLFVMFILTLSAPGGAQNLADYTAYPPFVTNAVAPNVLMVLDHSGSMQYPAYIECDFGGYNAKQADCGKADNLNTPQYGYDLTKEYYGYFRTDKYYDYSNKFIENETCSFGPDDEEFKVGNNAGCISGNLLNWISMTRVDLLRKALIGGKSVSQQGNAHTLRAEGGSWSFTDHGLGCTFSVGGGSYPQLDHDITISDIAVTCGNLAVWASGNSIWGTNDGFRYIYQSVSGDFDAKLKIVTPPTETLQTFAKAGLMVRPSTSSDSMHVKAMATYGSGLQFSYRGTDGGSTMLVDPYVASTYPAWVRIVRSGDIFTYYYSADGVTWTLHGTATVTMPADVYIGMATSSYSDTAVGKGEYDEFICDVCSSDDFNDSSFNTSIWSTLDINTGLAGNQQENCGNTCTLGALTNASLKVDVPEKEKSGVIQAVSDKDGDGVFDEGAPRFGLMAYAGDREGCMAVGIDGSNMSSLLTALQNEPAYSDTPTGEALNEAWDYFKQLDENAGCNNSAYVGGQGSTKDPWYESGKSVACRKSYILLISDGEWTEKDPLDFVDPVVPARETHTADIRTDLDGKQILTLYNIYTFSNTDAGRNSMQQVAMYGGFEDYDDNTWPYGKTAYPADSRNEYLPAAPCMPGSADGPCKEWDKNEDGLPDTYYEASEGDKLETALIDAITDMLERASSGTSVSVLSTTGEGEGSVYQAYFFPERPKEENSFEDRKWLGYLHAFFVDKYGNLRENNSNPSSASLDDNDNIIMMDYSTDTGTEVYKCSYDANWEVSCPATPAAGGLDSIVPIWNGGEKLWEAAPSSRKIYTTLNGYNFISSLNVDPTQGNFHDGSGNATILKPHLRAADDAEAANIINWTRGDDLTGITDSGHLEGYRKRDITIGSSTHVWKLGDIIFSTPTVVARPAENYDLLYGDTSYTSFRLTHNKRRQVVYVGANDGMLHAFNAGCFDSITHQYYPDVDSNGNCTSGSHTLGEELWTFIPRGILPHLKWNTLPEYTHVYHVDLKPKITDVKIFTSDSTHVNGWGTILIGGFRYGGKDISWTSGGSNYSASPEYFALDITDPLNPNLLWTFSDPELGLSMSYPSVAKIGDEWYAIFGSGATNYNSGSDLLTFQNGNVFVLKISSGTNGIIKSWASGSNYWKLSTGNGTSFLANPITVDVDLDFNVDVLYIGEN